MKIDIHNAIDLYNQKYELEGSEKMTLTKLAKKIDYESRSMQTLRIDFSQFQKGLRNCPIKILKQISKILEVSSDVILVLNN